MRFHSNAKCKMWSRACRIDSWQNQLCIFITRMSIRLKELIFGHVTEIRESHWLICMKLEGLWVSLCPIERFDLYNLIKDFVSIFKDFDIKDFMTFVVRRSILSNETLASYSTWLLPSESKKRPAFERLLLPEYIGNNILQYLI